MRFSYVSHPSADLRQKFDLQFGAATQDEDRLGHILQHRCIELKTEQYQWEQTGNIFIEYKSGNKPSGLAATAADFWCHELLRDGQTLAYLIIPTARLKQICRRKLYTTADVEKAGDNGAQRGILLRISDLLAELEKC